MTEWWQGLDAVAKALYCIAIPSTLILIVQTILLVIGFGDNGIASDFTSDSPLDLADADFSADGGPLEDFSIGELFTAQSIMAFICVFSWAGIVADSMSAPAWLSLIIGFVFGFLAMLGVTKILKLSAKLAENGTVLLSNAKGQKATVYVPIPANGAAHGKVTITLQGRLVEADAITKDGKEIPTGSVVTVVDVLGDSLICSADA